MGNLGNSIPLDKPFGYKIQTRERGWLPIRKTAFHKHKQQAQGERLKQEDVILAEGLVKIAMIQCPNGQQEQALRLLTSRGKGLSDEVSARPVYNESCRFRNSICLTFLFIFLLRTTLLTQKLLFSLSMGDESNAIEARRMLKSIE